MKPHRALPLALFLAARVAFAGTAGDEPRPTDPRMIEANSLLSDEAGYPRAIELYRAVLAEDPQHRDARMWLARVLAWRGEYDASLAHYAYFLTRPDPPAWAAVERAEVLSWAGRYAEAEAAFRAVLETAPRSARAMRGLARVYRWSGRDARANETYRRALALEEDPEARRELEKLREKLSPEAGGESEFFADSDEFQKTRVTAEGSAGLDFDTRIVVVAGFTNVDTKRVDSSLPTAGMPEDAHAFDGRLGIERRFGPALRARVEAGGRSWNAARDRVLVHGELGWSPSERTSLTAEIDHGDFLDGSYSLDAVLDGLDESRLSLGAWRDLGHGVSGWIYAHGSLVSDGNERISGGVGVGFRPWPEREFEVGVSADTLHYTGTSLIYYDPSTDASGAVFARGELPLTRSLRFQLEASVGAGYARQDGRSGNGFTYTVQGGPRLERDGWWVTLWGRYARSQRATSYTSGSGGLSVGRGF